MNNLDIKPVPLHSFHLESAVDTSIVFKSRTGLDGHAEGVVPLGTYTLVSDAPIEVNGISYSWHLPIAITDEGTSIELTNVNATIDSSAATEHYPERKVDDAVTIYRQIKGSVFRVEAGLGHGSGFLIDSAAGLIVTNAHVVQFQSSASVVIDSVTRVRAVILARDEDADIAILRVNSAVTTALEPLLLAQPLATADIVVPGERVLAVGYPLDQGQTLTTGIVSSVREGAIISDVNINPGNSGGPMLSYSGTVVGVNTFGDTSPRAPGVAGAVVATRIWPSLEAARVAMDTLPLPESGLLPMMPSGTYEIDDILSHVDTASEYRLEEYSRHGVGPFDIRVSNPAVLALRRRVYDDEVSEDRREREEEAGVSESVRYSSLKEFHDWYRFATDMLTPVVVLVVTPEIGETAGSTIGSILGAAVGVRTKSDYEYEGDVSEVRLYRNGVIVEPLRGGTAPVEQYIDGQWVRFKDVANSGYYAFSPWSFAPDTAGTPPSIVIRVVDLKDNNKSECRELPRKLVTYVWNDFLPYTRKHRPDLARMANDDRNPNDDWVGGIVGDSLVTADPEEDPTAAVFLPCGF